jgi:hypothetical protein
MVVIRFFGKGLKNASNTVVGVLVIKMVVIIKR